MTMTLNKAAGATIRAMGVTCMVATLLVLYWAIFPTKIIEYRNDTFTVEQETVEAGSPILLKHDYCFFTNATARVNYTLVNGHTITFPEFNVHVEEGCRETVASSIVIPPYVPPGEHKLVLNVWYRVNPLRTAVHRKFESEPFMVTNETYENDLSDR